MNNIAPFSKSIISKKHTPQYTMHKYFARRPYNVFNALIEHYTNENDIVLDVFCGGGTTIFEALSINRKAIGVDLNPLSTFITKMQISQIDLNILSKYLNEFLEEIRAEYSFFYDYLGDEIEWVEWAYNIKCPHCNNHIVLSEKNKIRNGIYKCNNPDCLSNNTKNIGIKRLDGKPQGSTPLRIKIRSKEASRVIDLSDNMQVYLFEEDFSKYLDESLIIPMEKIPTDWDRAHEDKLKNKGIIYFKDLFTERNFILNVLIFNKIIRRKNTDEPLLADLLYFTFSASLRYTSNMTRIVKNWENGNPTSMDKHAYWLPNQYVETNIFDKFSNRINAVIKGLKYTNENLKKPLYHAKDFKDLKNNGDVLILNQSSSHLPIEDNSIQAVITDPPYGSNVQYAELSSYWNIWSKYYFNYASFINSEEEAITNRKKNTKDFKDIRHYESTLQSVFSECYRVLKNDGYLVFTFNNKDINVWIAILKSLAHSGFYLPDNGIVFQDFVKEYKNTSHLKYLKNIHGDLIYSFKKGPNPLSNKLPINLSLEDVIDKKITDLFNIKEEYTTSELYKEIFTALTHTILSIINHNKYTEEELIEFEKYSSNYIDQILNKRLVFENKLWRKRRA